MKYRLHYKHEADGEENSISLEYSSLKAAKEALESLVDQAAYDIAKDDWRAKKKLIDAAVVSELYVKIPYERGFYEVSVEEAE